MPTARQKILSAFIIPLGVMVNYDDLQFAERIMVARRSEISAEWKVRFAICIASRFFLMSLGIIPFSTIF
jgi:hypothetical protein